MMTKRLPKEMLLIILVVCHLVHLNLIAIIIIIVSVGLMVLIVMSVVVYHIGLLINMSHLVFLAVYIMTGEVPVPTIPTSITPSPDDDKAEVLRLTALVSELEDGMASTEDAYTKEQGSSQTFS